MGDPRGWGKPPKEIQWLPRSSKPVNFYKVHLPISLTTGPPQMVPFLKLEQIESRAQQLLNAVGNPDLPIDPLPIANYLGAQVRKADFTHDGMSGALFQQAGTKIIYYNAQHPPVRQRFTVAHEIGHLILHGSENDFVDSDENVSWSFRSESLNQEDRDRARREIQANMFAAALLIPRQELMNVLAVTDDLSDIANVFGVSRQAVAARIGQIDG